MKRFFHIPLQLVTLTLLCAAVLAQNPNGDPLGRGNEVHDQRAGSMLIYNYYASSASADTRIMLTNSNETTGVHVKLYFVDGATGQATSQWFTLAPVQTQSFLVSDYDPNITGYIIAMAVNDEGLAIQFDFLMGTAAITLASGHRATLGALAVPINSYAHYSALPRQLALDQIPSPSDGIKQMLVINRIDGSLYSGMPAIGTLKCDMFNQDGALFSFTSRSLGPQARTYFYNLPEPGTNTDYLYNYLPAGQYGWLRMRPTEAGAITGAVLYFRDTGGTTVPYPGGYNLRHLTKTQATLEDPTGMLPFGL
jgi:hypothetical protein